MDKLPERYDIVAAALAVMAVLIIGDYFSNGLPLWATVIGVVAMILGIYASIQMYRRDEDGEEPSTDTV